MSNLRVMVVDDHPLFREGIVSVINAQVDMEVVAEASDGLEALIKARSLRPDVVLMDISMPGCDGLEGTRLLLREQPEARIVMLTVRDDDDKLFEAIKSGAQGYLLKTLRSHELVEMLRAVQRGEAAISPRVATLMLDEVKRTGELADRNAVQSQIDHDLTPREQEVLALAAQGAADREIAEKLVVSLYTVKAHMRSILNKLQVKSRHEAARMIHSPSPDEN